MNLTSPVITRADVQNKPVFLHMWEVPFHPFMPVDAWNTLQMDIILTGVNAVLITFDVTDTASDMEALTAVDLCRDMVESQIIRRLPADKLSDPFPVYLLAHKADSLTSTMVSPSSSLPSSTGSRVLTAAQAQSVFGFDSVPLNNDSAAAPSSKGSSKGKGKASGIPASPSTQIAYGLDTSDLDSYSTAAGFRNWFWTSTNGAAAAAIVPTTSVSLLPVLTAVIDDCLEYWGHVDGQTHNELEQKLDSFQAAPQVTYPAAVGRLAVINQALPAYSKSGAPLLPAVTPADSVSTGAIKKPRFALDGDTSTSPAPEPVSLPELLF
jgi:hypothetical protein